MRRCKTCDNVIPQGRIEAIPDCETCVYCSKERAKTIKDVEVDGPDPQDLHRSVMTPERGK